jgi:hypothetical protein
VSDTEEVVTPGVVIKDYAWYELREIVKNLRELSARAVSGRATAHSPEKGGCDSIGNL